MEIFKPAKNWAECKRIAFEYWGDECLYSKYYMYPTIEIWDSLLQCIDPSHIFGKGANPHMKLIPANVIPLNRYVHSCIDQYIDPSRRKAMSANDRAVIFIRLVGDEVYDHLEMIRREK